MSFSRTFHAACIAACLLPHLLLAASPDAVVTFNEIHYNPPGLQDGEWIELHNQMAVNIDLSGWSLADGVSYTFPNGTRIAGGGFLIVAKLPGHASLAGIPGVLGPFTGNLANEGETIDLRSPTGRLMDRLQYGDSGDWPITPDGAGGHPGQTPARTCGGKSRQLAGQPPVRRHPGGSQFPVFHRSHHHRPRRSRRHLALL